MKIDRRQLILFRVPIVHYDDGTTRGISPRGFRGNHGGGAVLAYSPTEAIVRASQTLASYYSRRSYAQRVDGVPAGEEWRRTGAR